MAHLESISISLRSIWKFLQSNHSFLQNLNYQKICNDSKLNAQVYNPISIFATWTFFLVIFPCPDCDISMPRHTTLPFCLQMLSPGFPQEDLTVTALTGTERRILEVKIQWRGKDTHGTFSAIFLMGDTISEFLFAFL